MPDPGDKFRRRPGSFPKHRGRPDVKQAIPLEQTLRMTFGLIHQGVVTRIAGRFTFSRTLLSHKSPSFPADSAPTPGIGGAPRTKADHYGPRAPDGNLHG